MLNRLAVLVMCLLFSVNANAEFEIYMANQAGGYLVLTHDECATPSYKDRFPFRGYGTEIKSNGQQVFHEGCYMVPPPPTPEEAKSIPPGVKIIPVINFIDDEGIVHTLSADWFTSEKPEDLANIL